jgi:predicted nucleic acid-binding protein
LRGNIIVNEEIENRAQEFENDGIKPIDALHLACAEIEKIDYFCTCDDKFLKKARTLIDLNLKIVSPIELKEILQ